MTCHVRLACYAGQQGSQKLLNRNAMWYAGAYSTVDGGCQEVLERMLATKSRGAILL